MISEADTLLANPDYFDIATQKNIGMWPKVLPTQGVVHYINRMKNDNLLGAMARVYKGEDAFNILSSCPKVRMLYGIDSYMAYKEGDIERSMADTEKYRAVCERNLKDFTDRFTLYPKSVKKAFSMLDPMDFIFVDLHGADVVEEALGYLYGTLKPKGTIFVGNLQTSIMGVKAFRKKNKITLPLNILKIEQVAFWSK